MHHNLKFCKMHGLGNDFIIIDGVSEKISLDKFSISKLANRYIGIGFDQLLLINPSRVADFSCRIFNSDGSEAEQCGNGMRCVARFILENKLSDKKSLTIETKAGLIEVTVEDFEHIRVNMGLPQIDISRELKIENHALQLAIISMGNPHAVTQVSAVKDFPVIQLGAQISTHSSFSHGANVGFMEVVNRGHIKLRTFERGAGETLACGSNSCAAVVAGINAQLLDHKVKVELELGHLWIEWEGKEHPVFMTGPAMRVFNGTVYS